MLSSILKPAAPINPIEAEKTAARKAFKAAVTNVHALAMSRDGDAQEEVQIVWAHEWKKVAPTLLATHKRATDAGIPTVVPHAIMEEIDEADKIYTKIADSATAAPTDPCLRVRVRSPMVEDPVVEPLRASSPAPSISSRATGHSKMEVVIDKGKGKKRSRQDLTQEESAAEVMITHAMRCQTCVSTSTACVGLQGKSCLKCIQRKTACMYASRGKAVGGLASAAQPARPTAVKAGPSTRACAVSASEEGEEEIVVVRAAPKMGKGKRKGRHQ
ncbi:hypothetical protein PAXINDRAFT_16640 [Paxillus involutus ATCC 200175]|uniref:Uncharacterized protein n=1 Tax=Paxillus involutus ATCC 200175 TaxID=664439 RepID=A0A0C9TT00_PAXIN|nr:hypothetical protein PAXINDRAFT_16640 [Paxillus involutus ATCC 200175]